MTPPPSEMHSAGRMVDYPRPPRYRVHTIGGNGAWYIHDRVTGLTTFGGWTWTDAIEGVRARYDRLQRAHDYMTHFHPDHIDADEIIYTPGNWANG